MPSNKADKLSTVFNFNLFVLRFLGLFPQGDHYTEIYKIYRNFLLCSTSLDVVLKICNFRYIYNDLMLASSALYVTLSEINQIIKASFAIHNHRVLKTMLKQIDQDIFQPQTASEHKKIYSFIKFWKYLSISSVINGNLTLILWAVYPLIDTVEGEKRLPFISWYPYDYQKTPYYQFTYIYQVLTLIISAWTHAVIDISVAYLLTVIRGQYSLLSLRLKNIYGITEGRLSKNGTISENSTDNREMILKEMDATLRDLIRYHKEILRLVKNGRVFIEPIASVQLATTVLVICTTMFEMTMVTMFSSEFWSQITYQIGLTVQILLYCWFADQVLTESEKIPQAVFESEWAETSSTFKKNMLLFLRQTQVPITFRAVKLFPLSLTTFSSVIRTSWSYFTVLQSVQEPK